MLLLLVDTYWLIYQLIKLSHICIVYYVGNKTNFVDQNKTFWITKICFQSHQL